MVLLCQGSCSRNLCDYCCRKRKENGLRLCNACYDRCKPPSPFDVSAVYGENYRAADTDNPDKWKQWYAKQLTHCECIVNRQRPCKKCARHMTKHFGKDNYCAAESDLSREITALAGWVKSEAAIKNVNASGNCFYILLSYRFAGVPHY